MKPKKLKCRECQFTTTVWDGPFGLVRHYRRSHGQAQDRTQAWLDEWELQRLAEARDTTLEGWSDVS